MAPEIIDELKASYGVIHILEASGVEVVVRRPRRADWMLFRKLGMDKKRRHLAADAFLRACVVYPAPTELEALLERLPAIAESFVDALIALAGATAPASGYTP